MTKTEIRNAFKLAQAWFPRAFEASSEAIQMTWGAALTNAGIDHTTLCETFQRLASEPDGAFPAVVGDLIESCRVTRRIAAAKAQPVPANLMPPEPPGGTPLERMVAGMRLGRARYRAELRDFVKRYGESQIRGGLAKAMAGIERVGPCEIALFRQTRDGKEAKFDLKRLTDLALRSGESYATVDEFLAHEGYAVG